ncbi:MAG: ATP-binding cassette domain-containing protein [Clostridia bacterium]|nr:ATP-binding cassette domain-containing protein [Clostridia bacterium]
MAKLISGLEIPTKGNIIIDNINTNNKKMFKDIRKKVGIVFQNPENQILFNNVYDEIAFTMKNLQTDNIKEKIKETLKKLNMSEFINSETYELSLGQKQRITIAEVIATNPKYIVLDEPTTMLDPQGKEDTYNMIKELRNKNNTVIYVTNVMEEILISDKIIVIENGKIIKTFLKEEILEQLEFLKEHGIKIPELVKLVFELKKCGIKLQVNEWTTQEIIKNIMEALNEKHN